MRFSISKIVDHQRGYIFTEIGSKPIKWRFERSPVDFKQNFPRTQIKLYDIHTAISRFNRREHYGPNSSRIVVNNHRIDIKIFCSIAFQDSQEPIFKRAKTYLPKETVPCVRSSPCHGNQKAMECFLINGAKLIDEKTSCYLANLIRIELSRKDFVTVAIEPPKKIITIRT